jgi:tetratricopeptide (TPR) repeat protein
VFARGVKRAEDFSYLTKRLAVIARQAFLSRDVQTLESAARLMAALPETKATKGIASFYIGLRAMQQRDLVEARALFEEAAENAPSHYRARALLCLGTTYHESGVPSAAFHSYAAAGIAAVRSDPVTLSDSCRMTAVVRSLCGDHRRALEDLERLFPFAHQLKKFYPATYYIFLNSLAVELGEVGRIEEAKKVSSIALASPFAAAYPEWAETKYDLDAKLPDDRPVILAVPAISETSSSPISLLHPHRNRASRAAQKPISYSFVVPGRASARASKPRDPSHRSSASNLVILDRVFFSISPRGPPATKPVA